METIQVKRVVVGDAQENCYILLCQETKEAVIIDPGAEMEKIQRRIPPETRIRYILLTHGHRDHVGALAASKEATGGTVAYHPGDSARIPLPADQSLSDGDTLSFCGGTIRVIHTPGHTPGSVGFLLGNWLFGGDTVFPGGPGHTVNHEAFLQIVRTIADKVLPLPGGTRIYTGHGLSTTVARVRREYEAYSHRTDTADLCGDVLWAG